MKKFSYQEGKLDLMVLYKREFSLRLSVRFSTWKYFIGDNVVLDFTPKSIQTTSTDFSGNRGSVSTSKLTNHLSAFLLSMTCYRARI